MLPFATCLLDLHLVNDSLWRRLQQFAFLVRGILILHWLHGGFELVLDSHSPWRVVPCIFIWNKYLHCVVLVFEYAIPLIMIVYRPHPTVGVPAAAFTRHIVVSLEVIVLVVWFHFRMYVLVFLVATSELSFAQVEDLLLIGIWPQLIVHLLNLKVLLLYRV